jgi:hypothetical protein
MSLGVLKAQMERKVDGLMDVVLYRGVVLLCKMWIVLCKKTVVIGIMVC